MTDQKKPAPTSISKRVREFIGKNDDYKDVVPVEDIWTIIRNEVTLADVDAIIEQAVRRALGDVARASGLNATYDSDGRTVYRRVMQMSLFVMLREYAAPRILESRADLAKARRTIGEWLEANPECKYTLDELWAAAEAVADGGEPTFGDESKAA